MGRTCRTMNSSMLKEITWKDKIRSREFQRKQENSTPTIRKGKNWVSVESAWLISANSWSVRSEMFSVKFLFKYFTYKISETRTLTSYEIPLRIMPFWLAPKDKNLLWEVCSEEVFDKVCARTKKSKMHHGSCQKRRPFAIFLMTSSMTKQRRIATCNTTYTLFCCQDKCLLQAKFLSVYITQVSKLMCDILCFLDLCKQEQCCHFLPWYCFSC